MRRALLTLVLLTACKDKPPPPPPPPEPVHDGVRLIQAGTPPLQPLRYRFLKGTRTTSTLTCEVAIKTDGQGDLTPPLVVTLEAVVDDVASDGTAHLRFTLSGAKLAQPGAADGPRGSLELAEQVAALQGIVITETLAPDGTTSGARVETTGSAPDKARAQLDSLLQSLAHVTTQLPAEAVGIGATWRERRTLPPGGITGVAETVYTLRALTPTSFSYESVGELTGGPQTITNEGVTIEVSKSAGRTEAKGTVELERYALDVTTRSVFTSTMSAVVPPDAAGGGASTIEVTMATRMVPGATGADGGSGAGAGIGGGSGIGSGTGTGTGNGIGTGTEAGTEAGTGSASDAGVTDAGRPARRRAAN